MSTSLEGKLLFYYTEQIPPKHNKKNEKELNAFIKYLNNPAICHKSIMTARYQVLRSFETPFCCSLGLFSKYFFATFLVTYYKFTPENNSTLLKNMQRL